jgi:hypothetical protein
MVSTVSDHVLKLMKTVSVVKHLEDFQLSVAGGSKLPYPAAETTPGLSSDSGLY